MKIRVGMGYDVHQLVPNRPLYLGGIRIEHTLGLLGHSDADVDETTPQGGDNQADTASTPYEQTVQRERVTIVRTLIDSLPEKQRSCMQLRDIEGKTYKEIAAVLDITEDQVKVNIFRARQTIKQQFQKYDNYGL